VIVVTFNYRVSKNSYFYDKHANLGAYGFLAGTTVENEGISNAGPPWSVRRLRMGA
jgi:hypothetical protein